MFTVIGPVAPQFFYVKPNPNLVPEDSTNGAVQLIPTEKPGISEVIVNGKRIPCEAWTKSSRFVGLKAMPIQAVTFAKGSDERTFLITLILEINAEGIKPEIKQTIDVVQNACQLGLSILMPHNF